MRKLDKQTNEVIYDLEASTFEYYLQEALSLIDKEHEGIFDRVLHPSFEDLTTDMEGDLKTYHNTAFLEAVIKIPFAHTKTPYPIAFKEFTRFGNSKETTIKGMLTHLFQYHSTALFKYWQQRSAVVYEPNEVTYKELRGDTNLYRKVEGDSVMMIQDHPVQEKPFQPFLLKHEEWMYSLLMWIDPKETLMAPSVRDHKRFRRSPLNVQTNLAVKNLHKGYISNKNKGLFVYVEYIQCWVHNLDETHVIEEDEKKVMKANTEYLTSVLRDMVEQKKV